MHPIIRPLAFDPEVEISDLASKEVATVPHSPWRALPAATWTPAAELGMSKAAETLCLRKIKSPSYQCPTVWGSLRLSSPAISYR
jgi:hypothetical protein